MKARARLVAGLDDRGHTVPVEMLGEAPLLMRVTGPDRAGLTVSLVGGAAGPLGGDSLATDVTVSDGATLMVRSVAASLAQPGPCGGSSLAEVRAAVGTGASLDWCPQPLISVTGSDHTQRTTVSIADASCSLCWIDEVVLGRHDEPSGRLALHQRFTVAGRPLVNHTVSFDPQTAGIGRHGRHGAVRAVITVLLGGPQWSCVRQRIDDGASHSLVRPSVRAAGLRLDDSYTMLIALGDDLDRTREGLDHIGFGHLSRGELIN